MRDILLFDSIFDIAKVVIVGVKTIVTPLRIPGRESGTVTFQNVTLEEAPRSAAPSISD